MKEWKGGCSYLHHSWLPELGKGVFQAQGGALGCSVEEKLGESLVGLKLLAEEKLEESMVKLKLLLEERMFGSLVRLDLKHVEEKNSP
jgi:phage FluMu gp28-like protein